MIPSCDCGAQGQAPSAGPGLIKHPERQAKVLEASGQVEKVPDEQHVVIN